VPVPLSAVPGLPPTPLFSPDVVVPEVLREPAMPAAFGLVRVGGELVPVLGAPSAAPIGAMTVSGGLEVPMAPGAAPRRGTLTRVNELVSASVAEVSIELTGGATPRSGGSWAAVFVCMTPATPPVWLRSIRMTVRGSTDELEAQPAARMLKRVRVIKLFINRFSSARTITPKPPGSAATFNGVNHRGKQATERPG